MRSKLHILYKVHRYHGLYISRSSLKLWLYIVYTFNLIIYTNKLYKIDSMDIV